MKPVSEFDGHYFENTSYAKTHMFNSLVVTTLVRNIFQCMYYVLKYESKQGFKPSYHVAGHTVE
jgi:hypothetical protein